MLLIITSGNNHNKVISPKHFTGKKNPLVLDCPNTNKHVDTDINFAESRTQQRDGEEMFGAARHIR